MAPLCKAVAEAGILPGFWEDEEEIELMTGDELSSCQETDNDNDSSYSDEPSEQALKKQKRKIFCVQTKHLQDNHRYWMNVIKVNFPMVKMKLNSKPKPHVLQFLSQEETRKRECEGTVKTESVAISTEDAMETIEEENNTPHSLNRSFSFVSQISSNLKLGIIVISDLSLKEKEDSKLWFSPEEREEGGAACQRDMMEGF